MILQAAARWRPNARKNNRAGPLADRKEVMLTARLKVFFSRIFNYPGNGKFSKNLFGIPVNSRKILQKFCKNFAKNFCEFSELNYCDIFADYQHFRFNF